MANEQNLVMWKPGQSGNPKGRPKGSLSLRNKLKEALMQDDAFLADELIKRTIIDALAGDSQSRKLVWEYLEGKPNALSSNDDSVVTVRIVDDV